MKKLMNDFFNCFDNLFKVYGHHAVLITGWACCVVAMLYALVGMATGIKAFQDIVLLYLSLGLPLFIVWWISDLIY